VSWGIDEPAFIIFTKRASLRRNCRVDTTVFVIDHGPQMRVPDASSVSAGASIIAASSIMALERYIAKVSPNMAAV
jgi:hypothetical protein